MTFFKVLYFVKFCDEINFANFRNLPENTNKEAFYSTSIQMKNSSKILKRRIVSKKFDFSTFECPFWGGGGVTKLEAFQWCFVTK